MSTFGFILASIPVLLVVRWLYHAIPTWSYKRLAEQGDAEAQFQLALRYFFGYGIARDPIMSSYWMKRAAEQGHAKAVKFSNDTVGKLWFSTEDTSESA